ncbi:MAG: NUDIX hydrolase, partial [Pseudomonadota bacterium]
NGDICQYFVLNYFTQKFSGSLTMADGESEALRWFEPDALPPMLPNMKASLSAFKAYRKTGEFQTF